MPDSILLLFAFALALLITSMLIFYFGTVRAVPMAFWAGFFLLGSGFLIVSTVVTKFTFLNFNEFPNFEMMVKRELEDHFNKINPSFAERGLQWKVVPGHYWIELKID